MANFVSPFKNEVAEGVASDPHDTSPGTKNESKAEEGLGTI